MTTMDKTTRTDCKYGCGEPPHIPEDACLTAGQKAGKAVGVVMLYMIGVLVLIGIILALASR